MNYKQNPKQKRFIAGANCPSCDELDSLALYSHDQSIECVSCGYTQTSQQRDQTENKEHSSPLTIGDIKITRVD
ncbi:MAG: DNA-binding protein [Kangiella sp.]|nr:MAG: DNA-binding protein [Kangiella sp.]